MNGHRQSPVVLHVACGNEQLQIRRTSAPSDAGAIELEQRNVLSRFRVIAAHRQYRFTIVTAAEARRRLLFFPDGDVGVREGSRTHICKIPGVPRVHAVHRVDRRRQYCALDRRWSDG
jgi:hypothetical protein